MLRSRVKKIDLTCVIWGVYISQLVAVPREHCKAVFQKQRQRGFNENLCSAHQLQLERQNQSSSLRSIAAYIYLRES